MVRAAHEPTSLQVEGIAMPFVGDVAHKCADSEADEEKERGEPRS